MKKNILLVLFFPMLLSAMEKKEKPTPTNYKITLFTLWNTLKNSNDFQSGHIKNNNKKILGTYFISPSKQAYGNIIFGKPTEQLIQFYEKKFGDKEYSLVFTPKNFPPHKLLQQLTQKKFKQYNAINMQFLIENHKPNPHNSNKAKLNINWIQKGDEKTFNMWCKAVAHVFNVDLPDIKKFHKPLFDTDNQVCFFIGLENNKPVATAMTMKIKETLHIFNLDVQKHAEKQVYLEKMLAYCIGLYKNLIKSVTTIIHKNLYDSYEKMGFKAVNTFFILKKIREETSIGVDFLPNSSYSL